VSASSTTSFSGLNRAAHVLPVYAAQRLGSTLGSGWWSALPDGTCTRRVT